MDYNPSPSGFPRPGKLAEERKKKEEKPDPNRSRVGRAGFDFCPRGRVTEALLQLIKKINLLRLTCW
jgi:hypothetical protein